VQLLRLSTHLSPLWEIFEFTMEGPFVGNPFTDVQLTATFALGRRLVTVDGFYDGGGKYKVRFMPDAEGEWGLRDQQQCRSAQWEDRKVCMCWCVAGGAWSCDGTESTSLRVCGWDSIFSVWDDVLCVGAPE
jgi:hypothetical protein